MVAPARASVDLRVAVEQLAPVPTFGYTRAKARPRNWREVESSEQGVDSHKESLAACAVDELGATWPGRLSQHRQDPVWLPLLSQFEIASVVYSEFSRPD